MGIKRFINTQKVTYHHSSIESFSEDNKPFGSGVSKGFSSTKYAWLSDFLFNHTDNDYINPHIGTISFFSDREIFLSEYGNVTSIYDNYPFLSNIPRKMYSDSSFEMTTKQYSQTGQKYAEFDLIEYLNESQQVIQDSFGSNFTIQVNHGYHRAPVYVAVVYKNDMIFEDSPSQYYDRYLFMRPLRTFSSGGELTIQENGFTYDPPNFSGEVMGKTSDILMSEVLANDPLSTYNRIIDYKIYIDNPKTHYIMNEDTNWIISSEKISAGSTDYDPPESFLFSTDSDFKAFDMFELYFDGYFDQLLHYPEISQNHAIEPRKSNWSVPFEGPKSGTMTLNPGNHLSQASDQSRVMYSVSSWMLTRHTSPDRYRVRTEDPYSANDLLYGIDAVTERNRRNIGNITTEPYMVVKPIMNGQVIEYNFIKRDGSLADYDQDESAYLASPDVFLQIKAPLPYITEINRQLSKNDKNTDIINTIIFEDESANFADWNANLTEFYNDFGSDEDAFWMRQDNALDDLVGGPVGVGKYKAFFINSYGPQASKYSNGTMKIAGMGMRIQSRTKPDGSFKVLRFTTIYTTNYTPKASYAPGDVSSVPLANEDVELYTSNSGSFEEFETIRPVMKLPGVNGYTKIIERNIDYQTRRHPDGDYIVTYSVEFPYAPGSFRERVEMNFQVDNEDFPEYIPSQVFEIVSHLKAGSHALDDVGTYDDHNERYAVDSDGAVTFFTLFGNQQRGFVTRRSNTENGEAIMKYPGHLMYPERNWLHMSMIKPQDTEFSEYTTYEFEIEDDSGAPLPFYKHDVKLGFLIDNRVWKFGDQKYISYIDRENPSYVCEMDISTLLEDFTTYQKTYSAIPDEKRWLFAYFSGFAYMIAASSTYAAAPVETTLGGVNDLTTDLTKSSIAIEIWDSKSDIGNDQVGNWRPFSLVSTDTSKVAGKLIIDNLYIVDYAAHIQDNPQQEFDDITSMIIGFSDFLNPLLSDSFPLDAFNEIANQGNLCLSYPDGGKNYHIVWAEEFVPPIIPTIYPSIKVLKIYVKESIADLTTDLLSQPGVVLDPDDLPVGDPPLGLLSIHHPAVQISKNQNFEFTSNKPSSTILTDFATKYIDLKSTEGTNGISDFERYVSESNKILFRLRIIRDKEFPVDYVNEDVGEMQYVDNSFKIPGNIIGNVNWGAYPWGNGVTFDTAFDWAKINIQERVRKFGLSYFKCASK